MTTSDSEDFESADEEIEPDSKLHTSKSKSHSQELGVEGVERDNRKCSDLPDDVRGVSSMSLHGNNENKLENDYSVNSSHSLSESLEDKTYTDIFEAEKTCEENLENADLIVSKDENTSVEKFDAKSDSQDVLQDPTNQKSAKGHRGKRPQKTKENKSGPLKLGVRLTAGANKSVQDKSEDSTDMPERTPSNASQPIEEHKRPEAEAYTSLLDKMSGMTSKSNSDETKKESEHHQVPESSAWGFGKSLIGGSGWGSVGGWGSSLLNTATLSVSTLGSHVTQGISTVLETVEAGIGAPSPEELAKKLKEEEEIKKLNPSAETSGKEKMQEGEDADPDATSGELEMEEAWGDWNEDGGVGDGSKAGTGLLSLVTGMTQVTGKVLSTGLDTLEVIGKKTMEVLQEGDPGLKKKRALLLGDDDTVVLSQVLREAKEKAEAEALLAEEKEAMRKAHFETLFDDFQGLVHLEALEMLSRQSDLRLKSMLLKETGPALRGLQIRLAAVQEMCEIPDQDEDEENAPTLSEVLPDALKNLRIEISADKMIQSSKDSFSHLETMKTESEEDGSKVTARIIHQEAITALATLTAHSIEVFHKVTELILVKEGKSREVKEEAKALVGITTALTSEVNKIAAEYSEFLSTKLNDDSLSVGDREKIESSITSIFLEASNSSTYIQDAFQLMVPVLQVGAVA